MNPCLISCNEVLEEVFVVTSTIQMFEGYPHAFVLVVFCKHLRNPTRTNLSKIEFLVDNVMHNSLWKIKLCDFQNKKVVMNAVIEYFDGKCAAYFRDGIFKLLRRWEKCINSNGDYVEK